MCLINLINENLIYTKTNYATKEEFFKNVHGSLYKLGYVTEEFNKRILEREIEFPTAINIGDYGIAIPHTDAEYVRKEFISIYTFKQPLILKSMKNKKENVSVCVAFILGFSQSHNRLKVLMELMSLIRNRKLVETIVNLNSSKEVLNIINHKCMEV